ncbi:hypothetical protein C8J57DRAFT_1470491 [Mycena rebaudengoi]|nr:hypothetical protein C8J57DRAFT_1470491 [Mycena rebaudengoi]
MVTSALRVGFALDSFTACASRVFLPSPPHFAAEMKKLMQSVLDGYPSFGSWACVLFFFWYIVYILACCNTDSGKSRMVTPQTKSNDPPHGRAPLPHRCRAPNQGMFEGGDGAELGKPCAAGRGVNSSKHNVRSAHVGLGRMRGALFGVLILGGELAPERRFACVWRGARVVATATSSWVNSWGRKEDGRTRCTRTCLYSENEGFGGICWRASASWKWS